MPEYRAYIVGADGHFVGFEPLICRDDAEAVTKARRLLDEHDIELWNRERFVVKLEAGKPETSHSDQARPENIEGSGGQAG